MDIGVIANPASGKDIRRLTARASVFDNQEKSAIVRRCLAGIEGICPTARIHYFPDSHQIARAALSGSALCGSPLEMSLTGSSADSSEAARQLSFVDVLISLGGDGTNRAIAKSLGDVPLIALSTGTNNAFPVLCEATSAGLAAALIASAQVDLAEVAPKTKVVHVEFRNGEQDLALIDVVGTVDRFAGTRAIVDPSQFIYAAVSVADPSKVGMTAIAGMASVVKDEDECGLGLVFPDGAVSKQRVEVHAPIAPGVVSPIAISRISRMPLGERFHFSGASMMAFDGERERVLSKDEEVTMWVERDGPRRVDVTHCLQLTARNTAIDRLFTECRTNHAH